MFNEQGWWFELRWRLRKYNEENVRNISEIKLSGLGYGLGRRREVSRRTHGFWFVQPGDGKGSVSV